jgi:hypothetical protein
MRFVKYVLIWISSNLSIPFWMIGHVHLMTNIYADAHEILASLGMNILVAVGFWISWKDYEQEQNEKDSPKVADCNCSNCTCGNSNLR